jgi:hypothetical protein
MSLSSVSFLSQNLQEINMDGFFTSLRLLIPVIVVVIDALPSALPLDEHRLLSMKLLVFYV